MKEACDRYFRKINTLARGDRAALKRGAGIPLSSADGKAVAAFYRCLPYGIPEKQEDRWFAVACLCCLWDAEAVGGEALEKVIGRMIASEAVSSSVQHRVEVLLDAAWDPDGYMLTKLARLIRLIRQKSGGMPLDFPALLEDLIYWNGENQSVQRKWARAIFANTFEKEEEM